MLTLSKLTDLDAGLVGLGEILLSAGYSFVTPTPASHGRVNARSQNRWAEDLRGVFGWSRPFRPGVLPGAIVEQMRAAEVLETVAGGHRSAVRFSTLDGLPFAHSAFPTVQEDAVFFGPDTYRFTRSIRHELPARVRRAVDIGCGAGPGAIVVAEARRDAEVFAVDINEAALRLTRVNAALAGVSVEARRSDLLSGLDGSFDLIVANPPYLVDPGERTYRHGGGVLGADLSLKILETAIDRLAPGGKLILYTGAAIIGGIDPFLAESRSRLEGRGAAWTYEEIDPDVFGEELEQGVYAAAERIAAVLLTVTNKN